MCRPARVDRHSRGLLKHIALAGCAAEYVPQGRLPPKNTWTVAAGVIFKRHPAKRKLPSINAERGA